ncbi:MAG: tetratricopeptide repeat protein [Aureispira sp.]|nr:tetratricopeptide repeat protein [Aureispira sp.]
MKKQYWILLLALGVVVSASAQKKMPWKKRAKEAAEYEKSGDFNSAAVFYEGIYAEKPDKEEYIYKAGNCYYLIRDYANAVKCLEKVKEKNEEYDKPGYKYAICLKQSGQPEKAKIAFDEFIRAYKAEDKDVIKELVETEIKGCNFALKAKEFTSSTISLQHLDANINTDKTEFAPIPFNNDVLYFSSTVSGVAKIYRTQQKGDKWAHRQTPSIFTGKMERPHFGNGAFTPNGKRFYFTQCDLDDGKPQCDIYLMEEKDGEWSKPVRLPDYVNAEGANTTHPFVTVIEDKEVLYFASDREGGKGGLDLWYCTRTTDSRGNNFTLPKNLGRNINTPGDEITPYYHNSSEELYFSSNGRVSAGGLDIFKSKGSKMKWEVAQNLGFPTNSSADDLYYIISESHGGGYLVSNRVFDPHKVATTNDDVFYFGESRVIVTIEGMVTGADIPGTVLEDVNVKLFELIDDSEELAEDRMLSVAEYKFTLKPKTKYLVEISKPNSDYLIASYEVNTNNFTKTETVTKDIELKLPEVAVNTDPDPVDPDPTDPIEPETDWDAIRNAIVPPSHDNRDNAYTLPAEPIDPETGEEYTGDYLTMYNDIQNDVAKLSVSNEVYYDTDGKTLLPYMGDVVNNDPDPDPDPEPDPILVDPVGDTYEEVEDAPEGVIYKVQVSAVRKFREYKYEDLTTTGTEKLDFEQIDGGLTRVLIIPEDDKGNNGYKSKGRALNVLEYVINNTRFERAFVIAYRDGERVGEGFRGMDEDDGLDDDTEEDETDTGVEDDYDGF